MTFTEKALFNIDLFEQNENLLKNGKLIFENELYMFFTPAVQTNPKQSRFDVLNKNKDIITNNRKEGLIIIRYFDNFLIANLKEFADKFLVEKYGYSTTRGEKWEFRVINKDGKYHLKIKKEDQIKLDLIEYNREELINLLDNEYEFKKDNFENMDSKILTTHIQTYIKSKGFNYSDANIKNLYLSLRSKPCVIISGISGTGKTKIVQLFAESIGATEQNGQFMLIPVRPDWSDGSELLGYTDIANNFKEGPLTKLLIHAKDHPERPHFLLLDEMNLARVEYYFSDILSVMESRALTADGYTSSKLGETATGDPLWFPGNLYIIGTVNMDETTHPFSKKVLDRANTLQFNDIDLLNFDFLKESSNEEIEPVQLDNASLEAGYIQISHIYPQHEQLIVEVSQQLEEINAILKSIHAQVGYRVRDEICFYLAHNEDAEMLLRKNEALDFCYMQKILPRIAGSGERVDKVLTDLTRVLTEDAFPLCTAKIKEMQERLGYDEFTAFW